MGLDTSHGCWHGAYSAFTRWRNAVAEAGGYVIHREPDGYPGPVIRWDLYQDKNFYGEWDEPPADPLLVLIVHSDCEGVIKPKDAGPLAERLEKLAPLMAEDGGGHIDSYRAVTERFAAGLREAAANGEEVEFS